ncbi:hypothetical protein E0L36_13860 [Streptomyces sp. AJS327]|nr:hypothetical protein [Streptomyces sp. AJS327]
MGVVLGGRGGRGRARGAARRRGWGGGFGERGGWGRGGPGGALPDRGGEVAYPHPHSHPLPTGRVPDFELPLGDAPVGQRGAQIVAVPAGQLAGSEEVGVVGALLVIGHPPDQLDHLIPGHLRPRLHPGLRGLRGVGVGGGGGEGVPGLGRGLVASLVPVVVGGGRRFGLGGQDQRADHPAAGHQRHHHRRVRLREVRTDQGAQGDASGALGGQPPILSGDPLPPQPNQATAPPAQCRRELPVGQRVSNPEPALALALGFGFGGLGLRRLGDR